MNVQPIWDTSTNLLPSPYPNLLRPWGDTSVELLASTLGFKNGGRGSDEQRLPFVSWSGSLPRAEEHFTSFHTLFLDTLGGPAQPHYTPGSLSGIFCSAVSFFYHKGLQKSCAPDSPELRARAQMELSLLRVCSDVGRTSLCQVWGSDPPCSTPL